MRAKRSKQYKRAMLLYTTAFKFRQPYQVLVDAEFVKRMAKQKLDLKERFEDILGGDTKIMITQCCVSRLYAEGPEAQSATDLAKQFERRKCNHWKMKDTDAECIAGVMGDENRYRYCVATQSAALRGNLRRVPGVPLLFEKRGMILLEPPSDRSVNYRKEVEESKLHVPAGQLAIIQPKASTSKATVEAGPGPEETAAAPSGALATQDLPAATRATAAVQPNTVEDKLERAYRSSKKRKREPNPLSIKKKVAGSSGAQFKAKKVKVGNSSPSKPANATKNPKEEMTNGAAGDDAKPNQSTSQPLPNKSKPQDGPEKSEKRVKDILHPDPTRGVQRTQGDGQSKKALKRKQKNAAKQAGAVDPSQQPTAAT